MGWTGRIMKSRTFDITAVFVHLCIVVVFLALFGSGFINVRD